MCTHFFISKSLLCLSFNEVISLLLLLFDVLSHVILFLDKAIFGGNQRGGETIIFGKNAVERFHELTGCTHILRAHQSPKVCFFACSPPASLIPNRQLPILPHIATLICRIPQHGIDIGKDATTLTVFSSSHYCCNTNSAGALLAADNTINIIVFGDGSRTAVDTQVSVPHCWARAEALWRSRAFPHQEYPCLAPKLRRCNRRRCRLLLLTSEQRYHQ